jgi:hypothetical protein
MCAYQRNFQKLKMLITSAPAPSGYTLLGTSRIHYRNPAGAQSHSIVRDPFQFKKRGQLFIRVRNETLSIVTMCAATHIIALRESQL